MSNLKQAIWLAKFELRKSKVGLVNFLISLIIGTILFVEMLPDYFNNSFIGVDFFFLLVFGVVPVWMKSKEFQYQKIDEQTWGNHFFVTLSQLPIKKEVLVGSRFITYFTFAIPFQVLLLIFLYIFSGELRGDMSLSAYLVFSLIWMAYGVCVGGAFPAVDAGERITFTKSMLQAVAFLFVLFLALGVFHVIYGDGLVTWTIMLANEWPLLSTLVSIIAAIVGYRYYVNYAYKQMKKVDYLK